MLSEGDEGQTTLAGKENKWGLPHCITGSLILLIIGVSPYPTLFMLNTLIHMPHNIILFHVSSYVEWITNSVTMIMQCHYFSYLLQLTQFLQ